MQKFADVVLDRRGNVIPGAAVRVKTINGASADLYSANALDEPLANPVITDIMGRFSFYAANGRYRLETYLGTALMAVSDDILLEDPLDETEEIIDGGLIKNVALENVTIDGAPPVTVDTVAEIVQDSIDDALEGVYAGIPVAYPMAFDTDGQTVVNLPDSITTNGMALVVEGSVEFDFTITGLHQFTVPGTYSKAGRKFWICKGIPQGSMGDVFATKVALDEAVTNTFTFIGDYDTVGPLTLDTDRQILSKDGVYWRPLAINAPFIKTGVWATDKVDLVPADGAALQQTLATSDGGSMLGMGYPGAGYTSDIQEITRDVINSRLFGITPGIGLTGTQFTDRMQAMLVKACADKFDVQLARGVFDASGSVVVDHTMVGAGNDSVSIYGAGNRRTQINYSGTDWFLKILGDGNEGASPMKRFSLSDLWIYGGGNVVSMGGIKIDRAYFVDMERVFCSGWAKTDAVAVRATNVFNFMARMFQFANGFPLPQGQAAFQIGSEGPNAWNTSNVVLLNGACQYSKNNIEVIHSAGVLDNFLVDNVTMGKAGLNSFLSTAANVNNITIRQEHFESPGFTGEGNALAADATHIKVANAACLLLENNSQQDARCYIDIDSVPDVIVNLPKIFETESYTLTGNKFLKIRTTSASVNLQLNAPNVRTDQIDQLLDAVESGGFLISIDARWRKAVSEATWNSLVLGQPKLFQSQVINRVGSSNAPYDQMYSADGVNWGRMMFSRFYRGELATNPNGNATYSGSAGWFYFNSSGSVQGPALSQYTVIGWRCQGGTVWTEMRCLTGT
jgi:hypothetical protein